jgi:hypothetical protein
MKTLSLTPFYFLDLALANLSISFTSRTGTGTATRETHANRSSIRFLYPFHQPCLPTHLHVNPSRLWLAYLLTFFLPFFFSFFSPIMVVILTDRSIIDIVISHLSAFGFGFGFGFGYLVFSALYRANTSIS